jgi:hypothetical protein
VAAGALLVLACNEPDRHVLLGQLYEAGRDCIDPTVSIDIVDGPDPGFCMDQPTCIVTPAGTNGSGAGVYVTTMCGPFPPLDDTSGTPVGCEGALAALARGDICAADGTSSSPPDAAQQSEGGGEGGDDSAPPPEGGDAGGEASASEGGD